ERGAERIEHKESSPLHSQDAGHDAVELAQDVDEASEGDGHSTVSREYSRDLIEAGRCKSDPGTITRYGSATKASAYPIQGNRIWNVLDISAGCCGVKENRFYPHGVEARGWGMGWRHLRRVLKVLKIHGLVTPGGTICLKF